MPKKVNALVLEDLDENKQLVSVDMPDAIRDSVSQTGQHQQKRLVEVRSKSRHGEYC